MPSAKKVAWAELKVGVMALVAMILLGILVFLITGSTTLFSDKVTLYTYLSDSAALTKGANVRLNGILIGSVDKVELSGQSTPTRIVRVTMSVDKTFLPSIPTDSQAMIAAENVLGSKYINIKRGMLTDAIQAGTEVKALDTTDFDDVVQQGYSLLSSLQGMLKRVDNIVSLLESGEGTLGKLFKDPTLYNNLNGTVEEARKVTATLSSGKGTIGKLMNDDALYTDLRGSLNRVNNVLDGLEQGQGTAGKLLKDPALYDELRKTNGEIKTLLADLNSGKGSAGKFLKTPELHNQLLSTMTKVDTLMDKINTGQGTLGQLVVNPQMYESMNGFTRELNSFMKDFRANPKKFLSVKLSLF
ncbi:MAG: MCE family protein [Bryobacterales bacterium]|nr:MCE family protein [Bryobacterales bacterium]